MNFLGKLTVIAAGIMVAASLTACASQKASAADNGNQSVSSVTNQQTETTSADLVNVSEPADTEETNSINIQVGDTVLTAALVNNSSVDALKEMLAEGPVTIEMRDYGNMEKVGSLGKTLPDNDEPITTQAGDLILYQSSAFVIYYAPNSWDFTRLGRIDDITAEELKEILGDGEVTVTLSMGESQE